MKNMFFFCVLAYKCVLRGYNLLTCLLISLVHTKPISIKLGLFISPKLVPRMCSIFFRVRPVILIVLFQILWMFFSMAGVHQQAEQPNYLAEGQTLM